MKLYSIVLMIVTITVSATSALAAPPYCSTQPPALDHTLMAFKGQGAWYFLCSAPVQPCRIPPHRLEIAPPPPPCPPVCAPAPTCAPKPMCVPRMELTMNPVDSFCAPAPNTTPFY